MPQLSLCEQRALMARAIRQPIASSATSADAVLYRPVTAALAGNNTLIEAQPGIIEVLQMVLWNSAAQDLVFYDGPNLLQAIPAFPAGAGYELQFAPDKQAYFQISRGNAFLLNLSAGARVDGFLNFKVKSA